MRRFLVVSDVMTKDVVTVTEDTPFKAVAAVLAEHHISAVPVRAATGRITGVVSETDLLYKEEKRRPNVLHPKARAKADAVTAGQLMTSPAVTIEGGRTLDEAARLMAARGITRLVVMDGDALAGIVTRSDLLSAFLASDQEILSCIHSDVVERHLWDEPQAVKVEVQDGVVTLTGHVERRSAVELVTLLVEDVDGVVAVRNKLTWRTDDTNRSRGGIFY
ncbi:CBS domain-containing protein [Kribbella sp. NPDC004875]|uniref:CBS domain-containing protein n=1 Tax=Kribbella sp. NPDC004875 TaxID=3364107 RepID=UPI00368405D0